MSEKKGVMIIENTICPEMSRGVYMPDQKKIQICKVACQKEVCPKYFGLKIGKFRLFGICRG